MKKEKVDKLLKDRDIRIKEKNPAEARAFLQLARNSVKVVGNIALSDESSTLIFREVYEALRQLGDVLWLLEGYEAQRHEASIEILKDLEIKDKVKLNFLDRYKKIRHDANYRGIAVSVEITKEIIDFWDVCSPEIIEQIETKLKEKPKPL